MGWVVAAIVSVLTAIGAYLGLRSKFTKRGYDQATNRQISQANMVQKKLAHKDAITDGKVTADRVKIRATAEERLNKPNGNVANELLARILKPWRLRNK